jgi:hypothetical protein
VPSISLELLTEPGASLLWPTAWKPMSADLTSPSTMSVENTVFAA